MDINQAFISGRRDNQKFLRFIEPKKCGLLSQPSHSPE